MTSVSTNNYDESTRIEFSATRPCTVVACQTWLQHSSLVIAVSILNVSRSVFAKLSIIFEMETGVQASSASPQKFSRYRSVRIAALKEAPPPSLPALSSSSAADRTERDLSCYKNKQSTGKISEYLGKADPVHRQRPSSNAVISNGGGHQRFEGTILLDTNGLPSLDTQFNSGSTDHPRAFTIATEEGDAPRELRECATDAPLSHADDVRPKDLHGTGGLRMNIARRSYNDTQREAYAFMIGDGDQQCKSSPAQTDSGRRRKQSIGGGQPVNMYDQRQTTREHMIQRKDVGRVLNSAEAGVNLANSRKDQILSPSSEKENCYSFVPRIDAPLSAVNAGERIVRVKYNKSCVLLPVTTSTTADDILQSAAGEFIESIDINSAVLRESFKQLGIERPLRRYEHFRDVLNSWDHDNQNSLVIVQSFDEVDKDNLSIVSAPARQPEASTISIHHSQKPGVWDKRLVTLRGDGQIILAKSDGQTTNICHMSDFDLYKPTHRQMKKLDPPGKMCFAIKSQQKSAMFLTTANYVHFFSTKDKVVADTWYNAVQSWRSWYLVHVMGNGQEGRKPQPAILPSAERRLNVEGMVRHERRTSRTLPSQVGVTSQPAVILEDTRINPSSTPSRNPLTTSSIDTSIRLRPPRIHAAPPLSFPKHFATIGDTEPLAPLVQTPGSIVQSSQARGVTAVPPGQLGRRPSQRHRAPPSPTQSPYTEADRQSGRPSRSNSQRHKPTVPSKPLVDLTPQFQEWPPYARRGRGLTVSQTPVRGLVNIATSPEVAVPLPPSTDLRRPGTGYKDDSGIQRTATIRTSVPHTSNLLASREPQEAAFLKGGLLAQADVRREDRKSRKGAKASVCEGTEPMLNVAESSIYVPGSLLAGVERQAGPTGPTIDREKWREVMTSTGECS